MNVFKMRCPKHGVHGGRWCDACARERLVDSRPADYDQRLAMAQRSIAATAGHGRGYGSADALAAAAGRMNDWGRIADESTKREKPPLAPQSGELKVGSYVQFLVNGHRRVGVVRRREGFSFAVRIEALDGKPTDRFTEVEPWKPYVGDRVRSCCAPVELHVTEVIETSDGQNFVKGWDVSDGEPVTARWSSIYPVGGAL